MGIMAMESSIIINSRWRGASAPTMRCHYGDPGSAGLLNEIPVNGYGYTRPLLGLAAPVADGSASNAAEISIGPAVQDWPSDVTYISIWNVDGTCMETKQIMPQVVRVNGYFKISAGDYRKLFQ